MSIQPTFFTQEEIRDSQTSAFHEKEWREEGYALVEAHDRKQWELGDWMNRGVDALTKRKALKKAVQITKYAQSTLWDFARTARAFEDEHSRRRDLSWSHYKDLAIAKLSDEKRSELLGRAENDSEGKWPLGRLRTEIKNELKRQNGETPNEDTRKMQVEVDKATYRFLTNLTIGKPEGESRQRFVGKILDNHRMQTEAASLPEKAS